MTDGLTGTIGVVLTMATVRDEVTAWVACICAGIITVVTCGLQAYRMIRDRDKEHKDDKNGGKK